MTRLKHLKQAAIVAAFFVLAGCCGKLWALELQDWSRTAASNSATPPSGFPEGMNYSQVNDSARELMAVLARWNADNNGSLASTGGANTYSLTPNGTYTAYADGMTFKFVAHQANTGAATLNVGGLGAKALTIDGQALPAGAIKSGAIVSATYKTASNGFAVTVAPVGGGAYVGEVRTFAYSVCPGGWLSPSGQVVSRTTYAALFSVIGITFGAGDGSTTFALPDLRGEFIRGWSNGRSGVDVGRGFGSTQLDEFRSHTHPTVNASVNISAGAGSNGYYAYPSGGTSGATGGDETRPRNVALQFCIFAG